MDFDISSLTPETRNTLSVAGRYVDQEVAKGRPLDDVLKEKRALLDGEFWYSTTQLRPFSEAVQKSLGE